MLLPCLRIRHLEVLSGGNTSRNQGAMKLLGIEWDFSAPEIFPRRSLNLRGGIDSAIKPTDDRWYSPILNALGSPTEWVSEHRAISYTAVFASVTIIADILSSLPLKVYTHKDGVNKAEPNHPISKLLRRHPKSSRRHTAMEFRHYMTAHVLLWGNAYAQIIRNGGGDPIELVPLHPSRVKPEFDSQKNKLSYRVSVGNEGKAVVLEPENMFHLRGYSTDGIVGKSVIGLFQEAMKLGITTEQYATSFFGNAAMPAGILRFDEDRTLSPEARDRLKKDFSRMYSGARNAGQVAILEEGIQWQQLSLPQQDAQFLEQRKFQVGEIARIFRVPPHLIGEVGTTSYSSIEAQDLSFAKYTISPWAIRWEQVIERDLLDQDERYHVKHNLNALVRAEYLTRMRGYAIGRQWGILSANDCRALEELPGIGEEGDIYLSPLNMVPAEQVGEQGEPSATKAPATPTGNK
jgi:HK97 family phage portal protein